MKVDKSIIFNIDELRIESKEIGHLGIVAGILKELGIEERINKRLGSDKAQKVTMGQRVNAMVINGLGFANRSLYMVSDFFEGKAIELLIGEGVKAQDLNDDSLGRCLDRIWAYGATRLFGEIGLEVAKEYGLVGPYAKLDSTSFSLMGEYRNFKECPEGDKEVIKVTPGYSKDNLPHLNQVMMSLVSSVDGIPIWAEGLDGNSSDKETFHHTIKKVRSFQKEMNWDWDFVWVADSALYNKEHLLSAKFKWITRVPETIKEAKTLVQKPESDLVWKPANKGYKLSTVESNWGGCQQRWILVFSPQSYEREMKTLEKHIRQEKEGSEKWIWHLSNKTFSCPDDAQKSVLAESKKWKYHTLEFQTHEIRKHAGKGRPKTDQTPSLVGFQVVATLLQDDAKIQVAKNQKGRFILATSHLDSTALSDEDVLNEYKGLQDTERGFRFLKDPWFLADHFYVKTPRRIEALMAIMALSLLVYNFAQKRIRDQLNQTGQTLNNQIKKPIQNPTIRWIFQLFPMVSFSTFFIRGKPLKCEVNSLNPTQTQIVQLLGPRISELYSTSIAYS